MSQTPIRAIIFDCDGTLVDSETISLKVLVQYVSELGLHIDHSEAMERFAGNELSVVFRDIESRLGKRLPADFLENFRERQIAILKKQLQPIAGAHELLASLQLPFCVASNAPVNKINVCLQTTGLDQFFAPSTIFSAYDIETWKPEPDLFLKAADALNTSPEYCAVVEDSLFGIKAGLAAGMQVFGYQPHRLDDALQSRVNVIQHLTELSDWLPAADPHVG